MTDFTSVITNGVRVSHSKTEEWVGDMELIKMLLDRYMKKEDDRVLFSDLHTAYVAVEAYINEKKERGNV